MMSVEIRLPPVGLASISSVHWSDGRHLFTIEHEVRSATHPMYLRPLVNRNPVQTNRNYAHGHDQWAWAMDSDAYDGR